MITKAIPISSANAATIAMMMTLFELVVDSVAVVVVVAVVCVGVVACAPSVSSLSEPLPLRLLADIAAGALAPASVRASSAHRHSDAARLREDPKYRRDTRRA